VKVYVLETKERNADGDWVTVVKTYASKPNKYSYIVFMEK
jgi:hypothetical protein